MIDLKKAKGEVLMKKRLIMALMVGVMVVTTAMPVCAAPKQMADGNMFDAEYYATSNPDVSAVLGADENLLYNHYAVCGMNEGRLPMAPNAMVVPSETPVSNVKIMPDGGKFDPVFYTQNNKDVVAVLGSDENILYSHYVKYGQAEGRLPYEGIMDVPTPGAETNSNTVSAIKIEEGDEKYLIAADIAFGGDYVEGAWWSPIEGFVRKDYSYDGRYHELKAWIISTVLENQGKKDLQVEAPYSYLVSSTEESVELTNMTKNLAVDLMKEGHCKNIKMYILPADGTIRSSVVGREWYHKCYINMARAIPSIVAKHPELKGYLKQ